MSKASPARRAGSRTSPGYGWNRRRSNSVMAQFITLRLLHTILILFGVSLVAFGLIHLIPGNPLDILLPPEAPKEVVERLKVEFGFDKPLYLQYVAWLGRVVHGNLGTSVFTGLPVTRELLNALGNTLCIAVP